MKKILILAFALVFAVNAIDFLGEDQHPGFVKLNDTDDLFYWLFKSRGDKTKDPLVIWLTGGPGCASTMAALSENGPFHVDPSTLNLIKNNYSWNEKANLVFIDQPIGTGFSKGKLTDYVTSEDQIAKDFYTFMVGFYEKFPEYKGRELFITGESYAGHYVPAVSAYLKAQNNKDFNLIASAIGNGLVDPYTQYPEYATFAKENKLISDVTYYLLKGAFKVCQGLIKTGIWFLAMEECQLGVTGILGLPTAPRFNVYDIRLKCEKPPLCYDFSAIDKFYQREDVIAALGVKGRKWQECNMVVHTALLGDWMTSLSAKVQYLLENDVNILVYSGDKDFICNWRGGEAWTNAMPWKHQAEFQKAQYTPYTVNGKEAGQYKEVDNLTFLRVYNAGHMVPMDQPAVALAMVDKFMNKWAAEKKMKKMSSL